MRRKNPPIINKPSSHSESTLAPSKKPPARSRLSSTKITDKPSSRLDSTTAPSKKSPARSLPSSTKTKPMKSPTTPSYMIVDSLLPFHVFSDRTMFQTYTPGHKTHTTPYGNTLIIEGTGTVVIRLAAEGSFFNVSLDKCWHVPASSNHFDSCLRSISKGSQVMIAPRSPRLLVAHKQRLFKPKLPKYFLLSRNKTQRYLTLDFTPFISNPSNPPSSIQPAQTQSQISLFTAPQSVALATFPSHPAFSITIPSPLKPSPCVSISISPSCSPLHHLVRPLLPPLISPSTSNCSSLHLSSSSSSFPFITNSPNSSDSLSSPIPQPLSQFSLFTNPSSTSVPHIDLSLSHISGSSPPPTIEHIFSNTLINLTLSDSHLPPSSPILFNPWLYFSPFPPWFGSLFMRVYSLFPFFSFTSSSILSFSCPLFYFFCPITFVISFYCPLLGVFALHTLSFLLSLFFRVLDMLHQLWGCIGLRALSALPSPSHVHVPTPRPAYVSSLYSSWWLSSYSFIIHACLVSLRPPTTHISRLFIEVALSRFSWNCNCCLCVWIQAWVPVGMVLGHGFRKG